VLSVNTPNQTGPFNQAFDFERISPRNLANENRLPVPRMKVTRGSYSQRIQFRSTRQG
jgi:hypothetical protein